MYNFLYGSFRKWISVPLAFLALLISFILLTRSIATSAWIASIVSGVFFVLSFCITFWPTFARRQALSKEERAERNANLFASIVLFLLFGGAIYGVTMFFTWIGSPSTSQPSAQQPSTPTETEAYIRSQDIVKNFLKAPSTAKFESYNPSMVKRGEDGRYMVSFYVDAQNSFGAMLRENWIVYFRFLENDPWGKIDIITVAEDGEIVYP